MDNKEKEMVRVVSYLSETIGARGTCTAAQRQAGAYVAQELQNLGCQEVRIEPFKAIPSTYTPYLLSFTSALVGSLIGIFFNSPTTFILAGVLNLSGAWGFLAETNLALNWTHWFLAKKSAQNITARIAPAQKSVRKAIISAHLDTHRTPIFFSSRGWQTAFNSLLGAALVSMLVGSVSGGLGIALGWTWLRWLFLLAIPIQALAVGLCLHADLTPYSPGANDNASGAAVSIAMADQLRKTPLNNTEVDFVFTDGEEAGASGMTAYLDAHDAELGKDAFYIIIDQVGSGQIRFLSSDGLLLKHPTHPEALERACQVSGDRSDLEAGEGIGVAYTDALPATKRGMIGLTLCAVPQHSKSGAHWHQMTDTLSNICSGDMQKAFEFTWELLKNLDTSNA